MKPAYHAEDVADKTPLMPVGYNKPTLYYPNPWSIPCDKNWLLAFIMAVNRKLDNDPLGVIIVELRAPPPDETNKGSFTGVIVDFMAGSALRIKVSAGLGAGIGAGVGVATGAMLSPVVAAAGGVAGTVSGATFVYTSLTAVAQKKTGKWNTQLPIIMYM